MSRKIKAVIWAVFGLAAAAALLAVLPAEGAKQPSVLSLMASLEPTWIDGSSSNRIRNDVDGMVYANTPSTKKTFYGVEVTYTPAQGVSPGQFMMKIDQTGLLGRYVKIDFQDPSTDRSCDESSVPGFAVDPLQGGVGELETRRIEISTWGVLVRNADGMLVNGDRNQRLDMDLMRTGESKFIWLQIKFTPTDPLFDREYYLGVLYTEPITTTLCPEGYKWAGGPAELICTATGSMWEIRPTTQTFVNEPDNLRRLFHTNVQLDWLSSIKLRNWRLPFILRIWK
jgi:hypothetical protein